MIECYKQLAGVFGGLAGWSAEFSVWLSDLLRCFRDTAPRRTHGHKEHGKRLGQVMASEIQTA